jgi:MFS family permease
MKSNSFPFNPARWPFFYGWIVLASGAIGVLATIPGQTLGISAFTDHLLTALHLSRVQLSMGYLIATIASALVMLRAGRLYDRFGARWLACILGFLLGTILLALSWVDSLVNSLLTRPHMVSDTLVSLSTIIVGLFILRFIAQGMLMLTSRNMVMKWFERRRGLANGLVGVVISLGFSYAPRAFNHMIAVYGWQITWRWLAVYIGVGFTVFAFLFFRDNPEQSGLLPDGGRCNLDTKKIASPVDYDLTDARRTYTFWIYTLALFMSGMIIAGFAFHVVSIFEVSGLSRAQALAVFFPGSIVGVSCHFIGGWLSDRIKLKYVLIAKLIGVGIFSLAIMLLYSYFTVLLLIAGYGLMSGLFGLLQTVSWPKLFGRAHLGAISGFAWAWVIAGSAIGPFLFSLSENWTGSYNLIAAFCLGLSLILVSASLRANPPKLKVST